MQHLSWRNLVSTRKTPTDASKWGLLPALMLQAWTQGNDAEKAADNFWAALFAENFRHDLRSAYQKARKVVLAPYVQHASDQHKALLRELAAQDVATIAAHRRGMTAFNQHSDVVVAIGGMTMQDINPCRTCWR